MHMSEGLSNERLGRLARAEFSMKVQRNMDDDRPNRGSGHLAAVPACRRGCNDLSPDLLVNAVIAGMANPAIWRSRAANSRKHPLTDIIMAKICL